VNDIDRLRQEFNDVRNRVSDLEDRQYPKAQVNIDQAIRVLDAKLEDLRKAIISDVLIPAEEARLRRQPPFDGWGYWLAGKFYPGASGSGRR